MEVWKALINNTIPWSSTTAWKPWCIFIINSNFQVSACPNALSCELQALCGIIPGLLQKNIYDIKLHGNHKVMFRLVHGSIVQNNSYEKQVKTEAMCWRKDNRTHCKVTPAVSTAISQWLTQCPWSPSADWSQISWSKHIKEQIGLSESSLSQPFHTCFQDEDVSHLWSSTIHCLNLTTCPPTFWP